MPPAVALDNVWPLGAPDLIVPMPDAFTIGAEMIEETREFTLRPATGGPRFLRAVDLLPGTPGIVRSAIISVKTPASAGTDAGINGAPVPERTLAVWVPGDTPVSLEGSAFQLPAGAELILRVHYKKTWEHERQAMSDRSAVGLYFAPAATPALAR